MLGGGSAGQGGFPGTNGRFGFNTADGVLNPLLNEITLSKEWGAVAAFLHYWTPQLRSGFQLAYSKVDYPSLGGFFVGGFTNPVFGPVGALTTTGVVRDWTMINAAVNRRRLRRSRDHLPCLRLNRDGARVRPRAAMKGASQ